MWLAFGVKNITLIGFVAQWNHPSDHAALCVLLQEVYCGDPLSAFCAGSTECSEWGSCTYKLNKRKIMIMICNMKMFNAVLASNKAIQAITSSVTDSADEKSIQVWRSSGLQLFLCNPCYLIIKWISGSHIWPENVSLYLMWLQLIKSVHIFPLVFLCSTDEQWNWTMSRQFHWNSTTLNVVWLVALRAESHLGVFEFCQSKHPCMRTVKKKKSRESWLEMSQL